MNPTPLSRWDRAQLTLLRLLSIFLGLFDRLLNVHWGEHLLERMVNHWQTELEELDRNLAQMEVERDQLQSQIEAMSLQVAALHLGGRSLARDELRFDPAIQHDEEILDASIDLLVKQQLATIESRETEPGQFVYYLEPNWAGIRARLRTAAAQAEPEIAEWFQEGIQFIDEAFFPHTNAQPKQRPSNLNRE